MITKSSGSLISGFSSDIETKEFIESKRAELKVTRSALVRYGLLLAAKKLAGKESKKARDLIIKAV